MKLKRLDNKGMTLVEMIIGIVLLSIASIMLVNGFVSAAKMMDRATLYKNASATSSSSIELQTDEDISSSDSNVKIKLERNDGTIQVKGKKSNGQEISYNVAGEYLVSVDNGNSSLSYREFLPGSFDFDVPAIDVGS